MSSYPTYDKGDWESLCDSCGRKFKASKLRLRWDGLRVCSQDYEVRHPQDFVRARVDIQAVLWTRPESLDSFITNFCTFNGRSAGAGFAVAGCSLSGNPSFDASIGITTFNDDAVAGLAMAGVAITGRGISLNPSV